MTHGDLSLFFRQLDSFVGREICLDVVQCVVLVVGRVIVWQTHPRLRGCLMRRARGAPEAQLA